MAATSKKNEPDFREAHIERILETTKRLLSEVGSQKMTIRSLAAASGVAPATLYNRFGGKEALISMAVIDHYERNVLHGFIQHDGSGSPIENFIHGLKLLTRTCHDNRSFTSTLVGLYFKLDNDRHMPESMYGALYKTWLLLIEQMRQQDSLKKWVSAEAIAAEMCERAFAVILKWARQEIADKTLFDRLVFGTLSILLGASRGSQAGDIEQTLEKVLAKPGFRSRSALRKAGSKNPKPTSQ
ncbi:MAG: regulatory protein TetR [Hydrocarboniphaga sp.]|uniref:TetR/AcrR family transcriptional regulator n=1 Tax=Hydrocarboniphaga sp. TaxID=2033016 RepID=UPI0026335531|nr:TetR/AcrR family transcriptional regulator [Hydrocarboniphaga sp.]MDB5969688.1 regulatory protein TetR [Hydrocarboniphaga sp.]